MSQDSISGMLARMTALTCSRVGSSGEAIRVAWQRMVLKLVRFGIPAVLILTGFVVLVVGSEAVRYEIFGMAVGGGLSLLLFTWFFHVGVQGESDREREEAARRYLSEHGHWPPDDDGDDEPRVRLRPATLDMTPRG